MKKITALILSIIITVTFFGCDNSSAETTVVEKTFDEKVQDLAYIAELKQYDASAAEKACILYSEYQNLPELEKESHVHNHTSTFDLYLSVLSRVEVLTIAEIATELVIEHIKSDLLRPSSFELVKCYTSIGTNYSHDIEWVIEVTIDYSAQIKAGGFDREIETVYFYLPYSDNYKPYEPSRECLQNALIHSDEYLYIYSHYIMTDGILTER